MFDTFYAEDAVSVEAFDFGFGMRAEGRENVRDKRLKMKESFTVHSIEVSRPMINGENKFALMITPDATDTVMGARDKVTFVQVFTVENDRVVREAVFM